VTLAYFWAQMAIISQQILDGEHEAKSTTVNEEFLKDKIANATFYFERILPRANTHKQSMLSGWANLQNI